LLAVSAVSARPLNCRDIDDAAARRACYDKLVTKPGVPGATGRRSSGQTLDQIDAENERLRKALRPICKNC
jgi:hypothetical protein